MPAALPRASLAHAGRPRPGSSASRRAIGGGGTWPCRGGCPELGCDVGQRHPEVVVQDDDGPPLRLEPLKGGIEELSVGVRVRWRPPSKGASTGESSTSMHPPPPATGEVQAGMHGKRWSQASNLSGSRNRGQVPPGTDEGVLDRVSRELAVPEDQPSGRVQPRDGPRGRAPRRRHDRLPVLARRDLAGPRSPSGIGTALRPRSDAMATARRESFPSSSPSRCDAVVTLQTLPLTAPKDPLGIWCPCSKEPRTSSDLRCCFSVTRSS